MYVMIYGEKTVIDNSTFLFCLCVITFIPVDLTGQITFENEVDMEHLHGKSGQRGPTKI